jgi:hypothetical protein
VQTASAAVKEKPPDACSSGGKMQEAPTPCVSVSEFDYRASGKSRNQKSEPRLLTTFQNSLNLGQSARNKDSKQPQNTTQNYPEINSQTVRMPCRSSSVLTSILSRVFERVI